jgi:hypothetical protein
LLSGRHRLCNQKIVASITKLAECDNFFARLFACLILFPLDLRVTDNAQIKRRSRAASGTAFKGNYEKNRIKLYFQEIIFNRFVFKRFERQRSERGGANAARFKSTGFEQSAE